MLGSSSRISEVSPEADSASTRSPRITIPRSPCRASAGCRYSAGVPVEAKVAASLRPISPLLPMPVTTTRPAQPRISSSARDTSPAIGQPMRSASRRSASASIRTTVSAVVIINEASTVTATYPTMRPSGDSRVGQSPDGRPYAQNRGCMAIYVGWAASAKQLTSEYPQDVLSVLLPRITAIALVEASYADPEVESIQSNN